MDSWQIVVLAIMAFSVFAFYKGAVETHLGNAYGTAWYPFVFLGAFVWADLVVFGPFWLISSLFCLLLNDWILFLLIVSVFWLVRSLGETIYWFLQQFSNINRNPPENFRMHRFFKNDSVWFIFQILNQCMSVISIIATIYFAHLWLKNF